MKNKENNITQKLRKKTEDNSNEEISKKSNNLNSLKESINSFCFGDDINELIDDENLISWDVNNKNTLNDDYLLTSNSLNDKNTQANSISNNTDDDFINESFISNVDALGLTDTKFSQK